MQFVIFNLKFLNKKLKRIGVGVISLVWIVAVLLDPAAVFAQAGVQFKYQLQPKEGDTTVNNSASMTTSSQTYNTSWCTDVGTVVEDKKCLINSTSKEKLVVAAQDLYDSIKACVTDGIDVLGTKVEQTANSSCIETALQKTQRYDPSLVKTVVKHIVTKSKANYCLQCVGFVEEALMLTNTQFQQVTAGGEFWVKPPPGYRAVTEGGEAHDGDIFVYGGPGTDSVFGHVGIVKKTKFYDTAINAGTFYALEANGNNRGGGNDPSTGGSCDVSDARLIEYKSKDTSGLNRQPRFLRRIN